MRHDIPPWLFDAAPRQLTRWPVVVLDNIHDCRLYGIRAAGGEP